MKTIGLDPGFGNFKTAYIQGDELTSAFVPTVIGLGQIRDMGLLSAGQFRPRQGTTNLTRSRLTGKIIWWARMSMTTPKRNRRPI